MTAEKLLADALDSALSKPKPTRGTFMERRRSGIGGSDVAAILGFSKWSDAIRVYLKKRNLIEDEDSAVMERGRYREEALLRWYRDETGAARLLGPADYRADGVGFFTHPEKEWLVANIDEEFRGDDGKEWIADAKCSFDRTAAWGEEGTDNIPDDAFWQGLHYCYVRQKPKTVFVVERLGAWPPKLYTVKRDDDLYRLVLPSLERFWFEHVVPGFPPPPNFADPKVIEAIKALHPALAIEKKTVDLPANVTIQHGKGSVDLVTLDVVEMVEFLKARQKRDKALQDRLDAVLRHHVGDAQIGRVESFAGDVEVKRVFNKGGERPATTVAPYDYLMIRWPKGHTHELTAPKALQQLEGETNG